MGNHVDDLHLGFTRRSCTTINCKDSLLDSFMKRCDRNVKQIQNCKSGNEIVLGRDTSVAEFKCVGSLGNNETVEPIKSGAPGFYELAERSPPLDWLSIFSVGILGIAQIVVGALLRLQVAA